MDADSMQVDYENWAEKRDAITSSIINSYSQKKLIIAGPGTGKSYLFQQICKRSREKSDPKILVLSFINELVDDLSRDLSKLAEVKTLHSFALNKIPGDKKMFFYLGDVIQYDYEVSFNKNVNYNKILCKLIDAKEELEFYSKRRKYYDFFSPNCSVYTLIKLFEQNENRIPEFSQILIDEFQDFNNLESRLLSFLARRSPVVIVGDDDQSLYEFKYANPSDIRNRYSSGEYETYGLPYCSRCTKVIIDAYGNLIEKAMNRGYLQDRAPKDFLYFPSKKKDNISSRHPHIILKRNVYQRTIAYNIDKDIRDLFDPTAGHMPTVLVVCPLKKQVDPVEKGLRALGYVNIEAIQKNEYDAVMEGFILLINDSSCNLAWRILFQAECERNGTSERFIQVMKESIKSNTPFKELLTVNERRTIKHVNAVLRNIQNGKEVDKARMAEVFDVLGYNPDEITKMKIKKKLVQKTAKRNIFKNTPIKIVTILKSKGLTRDYTFLVNFDDRFLLEREQGGKYAISDASICQFLVALTRARERVCIYTGVKEYPTYVQWIKDEFIDDRT